MTIPVVEKRNTVYMRKWRKTRLGRVSIRANTRAMTRAVSWMAANQPTVWAQIRYEEWCKADAEIPGDCETDCQEACAYPGQFSECDG